MVTSFLSSCVSKKKMIYFQGDSKINSENNKNYNPVFHSDDILSITVLGLDPEAVKPFNFQSTGSAGQLGVSNDPSMAQGYLIDAYGMIEFPVIGKLKLAGLDREKAIELFKEKLKPYVNNPTIIIRILNYRITVLGEVKNPGTFKISNERITLLEALGLAGDLQINGVRKSISVIRDVEGLKTETKVDLTSKDLFSSPVYFLQQNDVVYVQPNKAKINSSGVINASNVGMTISILSLLTTLTILLSRK